MTVSVLVSPQLLADGIALELEDRGFAVTAGRGEIAIVDAGMATYSRFFVELISGDELVIHRPGSDESRSIQGLDELIAIVAELSRDGSSTGP